jgi:putative phosphoesterase
MRIAILSDAHDNIWNVEKALLGLKQAETLIFCGDFCAPFTLQMFAAGFSGPIHAMLGNNDGDPLLLSQVAARAGNVTLYTGAGHIEQGGQRLAFTHYPQIGEALARSGLYRAAFSGHTHQQRKAERFGNSLWVNPGEVMGRFGQPSYGFYDTETGQFEFVEIG